MLTCIEYQDDIDKIMAHFKIKGELTLTPDSLPETSAIPQASLLF